MIFKKQIRGLLITTNYFFKEHESNESNESFLAGWALIVNSQLMTRMQTEGLEINEIGYLWNKANSFVFLQIEPIKDIVPSAKHYNL